MKLRVVVLSIVLLMAVRMTNAQSNMGIKGGVNLSSIHPEGGSDSRLGFHAGLLWHIHLGNEFAFQPELVYSLQGAGYSGDAKLNLGYINAPFLLQLMFGNGFRLEAGPQLGFLVHARTQAGNNYENVKTSFKTMDAGVAIGFGFISNSGLGFDARYNHGLSNINKSGGDLTNRVFQVGLFYQFSH